MEGSYNSSPVTGLVAKTQKALSSCSDTAAIAAHDPYWQETRYAYDVWGNNTVKHTLGGSGAQDEWIVTVYDDYYRFFPIRQRQQPTYYEETAAYYGVNGLGVGDGKAYWGAMQEHCAINGVCTRQSYDDFDRPLRRWERVGQGNGWGSDADAIAAYFYRPPYYLEPTQKTFIVTEWRAPRCYGNFVRKVYDGLGQLVQEQRPAQDWRTNADGCNPGTHLPEIDVDYEYNSLGQVKRSTMPRLASGNSSNRLVSWASPPAHTSSSQDVLGRPLRSYAPNGELTYYNHAGRASASVQVGRNGDPSKVTQWTESDALGYLKYVRTYSGPGGSLEGQVTLTHDALGNLTNTYNSGSGASSSMSYDVGGRKLSMSDADLGTWSYAYNRRGQLTRQTDARGWSTCLHYDSLGRLAGKVYQLNSIICDPGSFYQVSYGYDANYSSSNRSRGQLTSVSNGHWSKWLYYNDKGLLMQENVNISGAPQSYITGYRYDPHLRPEQVIYPVDNEIVTTSYNSMGLPSQLNTNWWGSTPMLDSASYDEAGRLRAVRLPAANLWRSYRYFDWQPDPWGSSSSDGNGRLHYIGLGANPGGYDRMLLDYRYDSFGNISAHNANEGAWNYFGYDQQNRLTSGYGKTYSYDGAGRLTNYEGTAQSIRPRPHLSVPNSNYAVDANGNLTNRNGQTLSWDAENHLTSVVGPGVNESYLYDTDGQRVKKVSNGVASYYPNQYYEQTGSVVTKYQYFGGQRTSMHNNGPGSFHHYDLHSDHLGSTVLVTGQGGPTLSGQRYSGYGKYRPSDGGLQTDHRFTGQKADATGLLYYNARYYDPQLGTFISPDTFVPDPGNVFDYNRYMYVRGNPLKYRDPSGHQCENFNAEGEFTSWDCGLPKKTFQEDLDTAQTTLDIAGTVDPTPISDGINATIYFARGRRVDGSLSLLAMVPYVGDAAKALKYSDEAVEAGQSLLKKLDEVPCANSFSAETLVATAEGLRPIDEVKIGDWVLAWDEATGATRYYLVSAEHVHLDPAIVKLVINGEGILTTPEHPFYANGRWVEAGELQVGDTIRRSNGDSGVVESIKVTGRSQWMYNLTVDRAHTFFVGQGQWLVHNANCLLGSIQDSSNYPKGFVQAKDGKNKIQVNNKKLLNDLRSVGGRNWHKIYQDGYDAKGNKVSIHYFQDESGRVFDVDVKWGWSNESSK